MLGNIMEFPLLLSRLLEHAAESHGDTEIVGLSIQGRIERSNYQQLQQRSARLANALLARGFGLDSRLASLSWNTINHLETFYGVMGIGASLHTINPRLSEEHMVYMINQVEDQLIFVDADSIKLAEGIAAKVTCVKQWVYLDEGEPLPDSSLNALVRKSDWLAAYPETIEWPQFDERQATTICYTSGTTGYPKGVVHSHRSTILSAMNMSMADMYGGYKNGALDVFMPIAPFFHTNGWQMPYTAPMNGCKLVLPGRDFSPENLLRLIEEEGVTVAGAVPTVWMDIFKLARQQKLSLSSMRAGLVAGTRPAPSLLDDFDEFNIDVLQVWGMTECVAGTKGTLYPGVIDLPDEQRQQRRLNYQGRTSFLTQFKVVDEQGERLAHDGQSSGTMLIRGGYVCSHYLGQENSRQRWLDTGDIARISSQGEVEIVDRAKDVIKSGGEWISSPQLEGAAMSHAAVNQAAVIAIPHPRWQERPLLLCTLQEGQICTAEALLDHMQDKVVSWWLPDKVLFIDDMPLTATGKINKGRLRELYVSA